MASESRDWTKEPYTWEEIRNIYLAQEQRAGHWPFFRKKASEVSEGSDYKDLVDDQYIYGNSVDGIKDIERTYNDLVHWKHKGPVDNVKTWMLEATNIGAIEAAQALIQPDIASLKTYETTFKRRMADPLKWAEASQNAFANMSEAYSASTEIHTAVANAIDDQITPAAPGGNTELFAVQIFGSAESISIESDDVAPIQAFNFVDAGGRQFFNGVWIYLNDPAGAPWVTTDGDNSWTLVAATTGAVDVLTTTAIYLVL